MGSAVYNDTVICSHLQSLKVRRIDIPLLGHPSVGLLKESQALKKSICF